jgi:hypothetical protein
MPKELLRDDSKSLALELYRKVKDKGIELADIASLKCRMNEVDFLYTVPISVFVEIANLLEEDGKIILN